MLSLISSIGRNYQNMRIEKRILDFPYIRKMEKKHFLLLDLLPLLGSIVSLSLISTFPIKAIDIYLFLFMWLLTIIGVELGHHRYFSHRSFKASPIIKKILAVLATSSGQGPIVSWVTTHRHHHEYSDTKSDVHSPHFKDGKPLGPFLGFLYSHFFWKWNYSYPNPNYYAKDLIRDPIVAKASSYYYQIIIAGILLPGIIGGIYTKSIHGFISGFLYAGVLRLFLCQHVTFLANSLCHLFGSRPYQTKDKSRNNGWFSLFSLGGSWHNNHHAFPHLATNTHHWWQIDPSYWLLILLKKLGLVTKINKKSPNQLKG